MKSEPADGDCCITVRHAGPLEGEIVVPGAKNSVLKLMAASLMADGVFEITNVPAIVDVGIMAELLTAIVRLGRTQPYLTAEYALSLVQRCCASIIRIVPDFERMTRLCVLAPSPQ